MSNEFLFDHERLEVYQVARECCQGMARLLKLLPAGTADLAEQLRRAALSIPLNIAEGAGDQSAKEKARFYTIAARSARECAAILDHMVDLGLTTMGSVRPTQILLARVVSMLFRLSRTCQPANAERR